MKVEQNYESDDGNIVKSLDGWIQKPLNDQVSAGVLPIAVRNYLLQGATLD